MDRYVGSVVILVLLILGAIGAVRESDANAKRQADRVLCEARNQGDCK